MFVQTCKYCEKTLITATMQNRTHIPLICSLCSWMSAKANVCAHKKNIFFHDLFFWSEKTNMDDASSPYPENLTEEHSIDGVNRAIERSSQRAQQHVGPFRPVVLEDPWDRGRFERFVFLFLVLWLSMSHVALFQLQMTDSGESYH